MPSSLHAAPREATLASEAADADRAPHPPPAPALPAAYDRRAATISILMWGHHLRVLNAWYRLFASDILRALVALDVWRHAAAAGDALREHRYPLARLVSELAMPRESARRRLRSLERDGWLRPTGRGHVAATERLAAVFQRAAARWVYNDFVQTAGLLRAALAHDAAPAGPAALRAALTLAARTTAAPATAAFSTQIAAAAPVGDIPLEPALRVADYHHRHLQRLRAAFDGDLLLPLLLGEVALSNLSLLLRDPAADLTTIEVTTRADTVGDAPPASPLRPCNAYSLATATGVPDATVRRRVDAMVARGWLSRGTDGGLFSATGLADGFAELNLTTARDFLTTDERLRALGARATDESSG
ncbi:MAG: hypothetical protein LW847_16475 [Burkholderiales bacterium]|nr:hypothetical protein [Burkholderiales bacterium]